MQENGGYNYVDNERIDLCSFASDWRHRLWHPDGVGRDEIYFRPWAVLGMPDIVYCNCPSGRIQSSVAAHTDLRPPFREGFPEDMNIA